MVKLNETYEELSATLEGQAWLQQVSTYCAQQPWIGDAEREDWNPKWLHHVIDWANQYWKPYGWEKRNEADNLVPGCYRYDRWSTTNKALHDGTFHDISLGLMHLGCPADTARERSLNSWAMANRYARRTFGLITSRPRLDKPGGEVWPKPPSTKPPEPKPEPEPPHLSLVMEEFQADLLKYRQSLQNANTMALELWKEVRKLRLELEKVDE